MKTKKEVMDFLAKNPLKTTNKLKKMFNCMCGNCKRLATTNPRRSFDEYCDNCKTKMKRIWGE
jgi:hypothetical protein